MNCPRCKSALNKKNLDELQSEGTFGDVEVDVCSSCNGIWFDKGELDRVDNKIEPKIVEIKKLPSLNEQYVNLVCPSCFGHKNMEKVVNDLDKDVIMDVCPSCSGIWLDNREFTAIKERSFLDLAISTFKWAMS